MAMDGTGNAFTYVAPRLSQTSTSSAPFGEGGVPEHCVCATWLEALI